MTSSPTSAPPWAGTLRRLAAESVLYGLAGAIGRAAALVTVPILSRTLAPADYGLADLATALAALVQLVVSFSGDIPAARLRALAPDSGARRAVIASWIAATVAVSGAAFLVLAPLAGLIAAEIWDRPGATGLALLAVALVPISAAQAAVVHVLRLEGRAPLFTALSVLDLLAQLALAVALVLAGFGPAGVVLGFIGGSLIGLVTSAIAAWPYMRAAPDASLATRVVWQGLAFLPGVTLFTAAEYVVRYTVVAALGPDAVGHFAVAIRLAGVMALASAAFSLAWGPYGLARHDDARTARIFGVVLSGFALLSASAALVMGLLGPEIITLVSGEPYLPAASAVPGLVLAAAMSGIFYILAIAAGVQERTGPVAIAGAAGAAVQVVVTVATVAWLGLLSVGLGAIAGRGLSLVLLAVTTRRSVRFSPTFGAAALVVTSLAAMLAAQLNGEPAETLFIRLVLALAVVAVAAVMAARQARQLGTRLGAEGREPPPAVG